MPKIVDTAPDLLELFENVKGFGF